MSKPILTPQQQAVVENRGGSLLVSAAAGSGKTRVLVDRLFRYVTEEHYHIDDFLIITYTKAAAAELRGKIAAELSSRMAEMPNDQHLKGQLLRVYQADIKTVDAFCAGLLRENTHLLAQEGDRHALTPDFRVLDENDAQLLRLRVLHRVLDRFYDELDEGGALLADTLGAGRDDRDLETLILQTYEKLQSHAKPMEWLAQNQRFWQEMGGSFDETIYAAELLTAVRRKAAYWAELLTHMAQQTQGDDSLSKGFGEKFVTAASGFAALAQANDWQEAVRLYQAIEFPRLSTPRGRKDEPLVVMLKNAWNGSKSGLEKIADLLDDDPVEAMGDMLAVKPAMEALLRLTADFAEDFRREKLRLNCADFSDQEHLALQLLLDEDGHPTELGQQISARYAEILVDEFQDTNEAQNAIFRAVSKEGKNLFAVGDVKQSIYRFRLADPTIFLERYNRYRSYEEAEEGEERKILLSQNFRSRREILDAANFVFSNILSTEMGEMDYGEEEALHFGAAYYPERSGCETEFHLICADQKSAENDHPVKKLMAEARFVAKRIRELLDQGYPVTEGDGFRPCRPEDIVILMRSPSSRTAAFAQALAEQNIPCSFEESGDFFHTMEISVMLSLLEIIDNPRQDVPLISVLRSPVFGFTPDRLAEIRSGHRQDDFYDALKADEGEDCAAFLRTLCELRQVARDMSVHRLIWYLFNKLNLLGVFGAMDEGTSRRENLIALSCHAERFESSGYRGLFAFVTHLRQLLENGKAPETKIASGNSGVRMMSIHKSKGLEFPIVILCDLDHAFSRKDFDAAVLVHPTLGLGPVRVDLERKIKYPTPARRAVEEKLRRENLAEEQRVLYVAMTRPQEKLILVDTMYHAETRLQKIATRAGCPAMPESVAEGKCYGDWILQTLLCRPEAVALRTLAQGEAVSTCEGTDFPWRIEIHDAEDFRTVNTLDRGEECATQAAQTFDPELLNFRYPFAASATLPTKVTATQLKGRPLDEEIAERAAHAPYIRPLEQPRFRRKSHGLTPAERGTATHLVLQYLDFENPDIASQIQTLQRERKLTEEQAAVVETAALERFLQSEIANAIRNGRNVQREYRFTLLVPASAYDRHAPQEDSMLLQGVVDCCFETDDGITVVDFKTDHVFTEEALRERAELYRPQLAAYSLALERVLGKPVNRRVLYFLHPNRTVEVS